MHAEHAAIPLRTFNFPPRSTQNLAYDPFSRAVVELDRLSVFAAGKGAKNKNYYERSRYISENKENMDNMPLKKADICYHSTAVERHFMPSESFCDRNIIPFIAFYGYNARLCQVAKPGHAAGASAAYRLAPTKGTLLCIPFPDAIF